MGSAPHPQAKSVAAPTRRPGKNKDLRLFKHAADGCIVASSSNPSRNPFSDEAPPAYTPAPTPWPVSNTVAPPADDAYAFLDQFDTKFLIDDSGSMAGSRWRQTADALMTVAPVCTAHDADGIDIYFLNQKTPASYENVASASAVQEIFHTVKPGGPTLMAMRLNTILKKYLEKYTGAPETTKPVNIICITDGESHDPVEEVITRFAKKLDELDAPAWQVGIQFFQVGNDPKATDYLKMLDDDLVSQSGVDMRDMVDTVPFTNAEGARLTGDGILKVVLGAVTRRLDRRSKELHR